MRFEFGPNNPFGVWGDSDSKRILIVDDNSDISLTLRIGLEESDPTMQVHTFDNPLTALLEFKPDFYD